MADPHQKRGDMSETREDHDTRECCRELSRVWAALGVTGYIGLSASECASKLTAERDTLASQVATLTAEVERLKDEIADAREACPSGRMQDHFDASLLELVNLEVSRGFNRDSEILKQRAEVERLTQIIHDHESGVQNLNRVVDGLTQERDRLRTAVMTRQTTVDDAVARAVAAEARVMALEAALRQIVAGHPRHFAGCRCAVCIAAAVLTPPTDPA